VRGEGWKRDLLGQTYTKLPPPPKGKSEGKVMRPRRKERKKKKKKTPDKAVRKR